MSKVVPVPGRSWHGIARAMRHFEFRAAVALLEAPVQHLATDPQAGQLMSGSHAESTYGADRKTFASGLGR